MSEPLDQTTRIDQWQRHVEYLAAFEFSREPIVSCYVSFDSPDDEVRSYLLRRAESIVRTWPDGSTSGFIRDALASALQQTGRDHEPDIRGLAVFARGGNRSFCLPMRFKYPLHTALTVDSIPHLHDLLAARDVSNWHIVLVCTEEVVGILGMSLGQAAIEFASRGISTTTCLGRQWARPYYLSEGVSDKKRVQELVETLDALVRGGTECRVLLIGEERRLRDVRNALPSQVARRLIDVRQLFSVSEGVVLLNECLAAFTKSETGADSSPVERLLTSFYRDELAVIGAVDSLVALFRGDARALIIAAEADLGFSYLCKRCGWSSSIEPLSKACGDCGSRSPRHCDVREELVKMADRAKCEILYIEQSDELRRAGGVGCTVRRLSRSAARDEAAKGVS